MKITLEFTYINSEFDQSIADRFHDGQESDENVKELWTDELETQEPVKSVVIENRSTYTLAGERNGAAFSFDIPDMCVSTITYENGTSEKFGVSQSILKQTKREMISESHERITFYLKGKDEPANPFLGLYVKKKDFPEELKD